MVGIALASEIERQQEYLSKLPEDFQFPLFNYKVALESQRKSAYKTTSSAAREIIDNSIEAGADRVHVVFNKVRSKTGKRRQEIVDSIAFIDNGSGMLPNMIRYALCWGGSTHYDDYNFIARFGFGLPNSSINQTRLVEVYSRTQVDEPIYMCKLDLNAFSEYGMDSVPEPKEADLPSFVQEYIDRHDLSIDHGTVVVWTRPDRLTFKRPARLKDHIVDDFGTTYRYFLSDSNMQLEMVVEGVKVEPIHPMFLESNSRYYESPVSDIEALTGGGARKVGEWFIPVRYCEDRDTGERHLERVEHEEELDDTSIALISAGTINVRLARFPYGFVQGGRKNRGTDAYRRYEIRKSRRGMSFVRANREIETVDVFPKSADDVAQGRGRWPLLQSYAYHWGVEVRFEPNLDDVFGITHDKQGVRPVEDFWKVLAQEQVDVALMRENKWQSDTRKQIRDQRIDEDVDAQRDESQPSAAESASQDADIASSSRPQIPLHAIESAQLTLDSSIEQRSQVTGESLEEACVGIQKASDNRKYRIEYEEVADGAFFTPEWIGNVITCRINKAHPFYGVLYRDLFQLSGGRRAKEAIDVLLLTLARAELTVSDEEMAEWYRVQRKRQWSTFLEDALSILSRRSTEADDEEYSVAEEDAA